jgi:polyphenol oxidase
MTLYNHSHFSIFFSDAKNSFHKYQFYNVKSTQELAKQLPILINHNHLLSLVTLDQAHATEGLVFNSYEQAFSYKPYSFQGDFIITNLPNIALGVATADCLPIIFFEKKNKILAVAHAGWQGTLQEIAIKVVESVQKSFGSQLQDFQIFFGPCASVENYEVSLDFEEKIKKFKSQVLIHIDNKYFFNMPLYNQLLLEEHGIQKQAFIWDYCQCTIANHNFCSYRRNKNDQRQMTVAYIKTI